MGCIASEMESAALFIAGAYRRVRSARCSWWSPTRRRQKGGLSMPRYTTPTSRHPRRHRCHPQDDRQKRGTNFMARTAHPDRCAVLFLSIVTLLGQFRKIVSFVRVFYIGDVAHLRRPTLPYQGSLSTEGAFLYVPHIFRRRGMPQKLPSTAASRQGGRGQNRARVRESIQNQRSMLLRYAAEHGFTLCRKSTSTRTTPAPTAADRRSNQDAGGSRAAGI